MAGCNTVVLQLTDTKVNVTPISDEYKAIKDIPIATVATAWDDLAGGPTVILVVNEALSFGDRMNLTLVSEPDPCKRSCCQ